MLELDTTNSILLQVTKKKTIMIKSGHFLVMILCIFTGMYIDAREKK
jgi:hypothetical protein